MNIDLLKRLLPGEVDEYLVRNEVRGDGRGLADHRAIQVTRAVMGQASTEGQKKVSCAVKLGQTHILCALASKRQECTLLDTAKPVIAISLTLIKDQSLNIRRDFVEEKEIQIKTSLKTKIEQCLLDCNCFDSASPQQLTFTFSVVSDDGNLLTTLVAGASDLLSQLTNKKSALMFSSLVLLHQGPPKEESVSQSTDSFVVDPTLEETQNLSNNLILVTVVRKQVGDEMEVDWDEAAEDGDSDRDTLIVEKVSEALRTSHSCQLSTSLNFKPSTMTMRQMRQAAQIGKDLAAKAFATVNNGHTAGQALTINF